MTSSYTHCASSTSSAYPDADSQPYLSANIHRVLSRSQIDYFRLSHLRFRTCASPDELEEIRQLHAEWFPVFYNDEFYCSLVDRSDNDVLVVIASIGDRSDIVGMITIGIRRKEKRFNPSGDLARLLHFPEDTANTAYILTLGVVDELRRKGVAQALLSEGIAQIKTNHPKCHVVYLHVIEYNKPAFRLYRKAGFSEYITYPEFYFIDDVPYRGTLFYRILDQTASLVKPSARTALALMGKWIYMKIRAFVSELRRPEWPDAAKKPRFSTPV